MEEYDRGNILHNLAVRVGQLEGTIKTFMDNWARQDALAHESRRVIYDRLELFGKQIDRVATDVNNTQQDVAEMKQEIDDKVTPSVTLFNAKRNQAIGAKSVWAMIGAGVVMFASALAYLADKLASHLFPKP